MLRSRIRKHAVEAERATMRLADVRASVEALVDEDLLDLADIFSSKPQTTLGEMAVAKLRKRNLSL